MQSSHSDLQRSSQIALSRSRFLQLAAGALLPFAGLPRSAAADENAKTVERSEPRMPQRRAAWGPSS
jgi:hypothetical protein